MRRVIACFCLAVSTALAGCAWVGKPPQSTARAIDSDIAAARNNGPTPEQIGQVTYPDVTSSHNMSVIPAVQVPINNME
jgi:hypothetical protein